MPDRIKSMRYVQRDGSDLMSDIEGLRTFLGESKQHVQGGVSWSETKFVIRDEVVGEKERFHIKCDDGFHYLATGVWRDCGGRGREWEGGSPEVLWREGKGVGVRRD